MNDITALMATMKAAAERAIEANERLCVMPPDEIFDVSLAHSKQLDADITLLNAHYNESTPANVKTLVEALEKAQRQIAQVTAERDALREGEIGNAKHSNTRAAADIYFQLAEECDIPAGGSLVEFVDGLKERLCVLESRTVTVKLPAEYLNADGSVNADMANTCPVVSAYREAHRAAGIQVIEGEE